MTITDPGMNKNERYNAFVKWCQYQHAIHGIALRQLIRSEALERWFYKLLDLQRPLLIDELHKCGANEEWEVNFIINHWQKNQSYFYPKALLKVINQNLN